MRTEPKLEPFCSYKPPEEENEVIATQWILERSSGLSSCSSASHLRHKLVCGALWRNVILSIRHQTVPSPRLIAGVLCQNTDGSGLRNSLRKSEIPLGSAN